ncbi:MAG: peptidylprolyl isomerase [Balneolaceae bacterium]|nr:peptidylprolyl isomerase [Balneolaceae bacterium]
MIPRRAIYIFIGLLALIFFISEYTKDDNPFPTVTPIQDEELKEAYPALFESIASRDASTISTYLDHNKQHVQDLGWKALASTPVEDVDALIEKAEASENRLAWFPLAFQELTSSQLRTLEKFWNANVGNRSDISRIFGRQGDERSLEFLMNHFDEIAGSEYEYDAALAIARLMRTHSLSSVQQIKIIERAFLVEDPLITRAYLYAYYRDRNREPALSSEIKSAIYQQWQLYGIGNSVKVDQFVTGIIPELALYETTLYYNSEEELDRHTQLSVELSQALNDVELNDDTQLAASILLRHQNPHVVQQALVNLDGQFRKGNNLNNYLVNELLPNPRTHSFVWTYGLEAAAKVDSSLVSQHAQRLEKVADENVYLLPKVLEIWQIEESSQKYLDRLMRIIEEGRSMPSSYAISSLTSYWDSLPDEEKTDEMRTEARNIVFAALALNDRGVTVRAENILGNESLFSENDFSQINEALSAFKLPEDVQVYQAFGRLYKERFEQQGQPVIDSLAAEGYAPLNRSLADAGWDVEAEEPEAREFRSPNWTNFWKLGEHPVWVLETNRGTIKVQLNPLSAPATVSVIDSLTRSGAYNGVPFHRVIPNFVIQGGDISLKDGFAGPDFVIPTEASELEYVRGTAGIASSGTDTEGSQYFIMHQWKPHLNGLYTLFGNVTDGMDVVDRIVVGDSVEVAYWQ